jgi:dTDP-4-dehydrorhamnose 3,5-epimerase
MLNSIIVTDLNRITVSGGDVLHAMRTDSPGYNGYGESYFSKIEPGAIKAWKKHSEMTLNLVVPLGMVRFVFTDADGDFLIKEIGEQNFARLSVPPGIWFGFKGLGNGESLILNISNILHDPNEVERKERHEIPFDWSIKL